ncbi:hypothetical protein ABIE67_009940 [Streptomyces sp. V4I8]
MRPGSRTRLCHRLRLHTGRKGERRSLSEDDYIRLIDGMHQLVKAPIVLVWDRLNTHVSHTMRDLIDARDWLTVFILPAYAPELNAVEYLWAHVKRSLANLSSVALDRLATLVRNRLKRLQYRPDLLDGFLAGTGLALDLPPPSPRRAEVSIRPSSRPTPSRCTTRTPTSRSCRPPAIWGSTRRRCGTGSAPTAPAAAAPRRT